MARTVRDSNLETRTARLRLSVRGKPYYRLVDTGVHLGYRRTTRGAGTWVVRLYAGNQAYQVERLTLADDIQDADGVGVLTFQQAQGRVRERAAAKAREAAGLDDEPVHRTVKDAVSAYLDWLALHRRPSTAREFRYAAKAHIFPKLGEIEVAKLTKARLRRWHEELAASPARLRTRRGGAQHCRALGGDPEAVRARKATANRVLTVLKAALNQTSGAGPWREVKPFRGVDVSRVRYLETDECRRLLNACPEDFRRIVRGALLSGCRYGELCRADVQDFSDDAGKLLVREAKSGKARWVPLDDEAIEFFEAITAGRRSNESLFTRTDGGRWGKSHHARPLLEACNVARIEPAVGFHILRHTWASHRMMAGMPLIAVAHVLGHADTRMVERHYGHLAPGWVHDVVRATSLRLEPGERGNLALLRRGAK